MTHRNPFQSVPVCLTIAFLLSLAAAPCTAGSGDVFIAPAGSISELSFAAFDGEYVAVARHTQQAIDVFTIDGEPFTSIPLAGNTSHATTLAVSNGSVYWYETNDRHEYGDLYRYDIAAGTQSLLYRIDDAWGSRIVRIVADCDHLAWDEGLNGGTLKVHTLSTGNTDVILSNDQIYSLAIDGDRVLFGCKRTDGGTGREIHVYSIGAKEDSVIPESRSEGTWGYGDISGDLAVWTRTDPEEEPFSVLSGADVMLTDPASASTVPVYHLDTIADACISDGTIVWVERESNADMNGTLCAYDIDTGVSRPLITGVYGLYDIREGYVLWSSKTPYAYQVTQIAPDAPAATTPAQPETAGTPPRSTPLTPGTALLALLAAALGLAVRRRRR
ncbi:hypothetical protein FGU65_13340 [Methanoculleus sp. FWC-SCC1]|uniref:Uncharacterized protein n=1 Tax=Methanoculleus frigidifontis TaxID=2584085 RepID=A0ABT8MD32_9EURY|nr:hypothetical protein [Methanoculleus sp. FWC-SCC1]MDN7025852.1 hypothetical protein [Methanoculleus sp. FWC-SCC1]